MTAANVSAAPEPQHAGLGPSTVLGYPRIGPERELKRALEAYWDGHLTAEALHGVARGLRAASWHRLRALGLAALPSNMFSLYDHVLDTASMLGAVPDRYGHLGDLDAYFAMARGRQESGVDVTAMEMTKWFDTNYHYIVPELGPDTKFSLSSEKRVSGPSSGTM